MASLRARLSVWISKRRVPPHSRCARGTEQGSDDSCMTEPSAPSANSAVTNVDVLIVGAGFSGLCMAIKLLEAGMKSFLIIQKNDDIGGTWWDNRYPGCSCDIPSPLYSFSFAPSTEWTRMYPGQQVIPDYLN